MTAEGAADGLKSTIEPADPQLAFLKHQAAAQHLSQARAENADNYAANYNMIYGHDSEQEGLYPWS